MKKLMMAVVMMMAIIAMTVPTMAFERTVCEQRILEEAFEQWDDETEVLIHLQGKTINKYKAEIHTGDFIIVMWVNRDDDHDDCYGNIYDVDMNYLTSFDNNDWYYIQSTMID